MLACRTCQGAACDRSQRSWDRDAALTSTLHLFEAGPLTLEENLIGLMALNRETLGRAESLDNSDSVVLETDSSESPVHGEQEGKSACKQALNVN